MIEVASFTPAGCKNCPSLKPQILLSPRSLIETLIEPFKGLLFWNPILIIQAPDSETPGAGPFPGGAGALCLGKPEPWGGAWD